MGKSRQSVLQCHQLEIAKVLEQLGSDAARGLSDTEARRRLPEFGANELLAEHRVSPWMILLEQFKNSLVLILLIAVTLSAFLGHTFEASAIAIIVLFAVLLGFYQEYRAERAIDALRQMAAPNATVVRDGNETDIPGRDLVPGDIVVLNTGNKVPADARVIIALNLRADEAALTGESLPVEKQTAALLNSDVHLLPNETGGDSGIASAHGWQIKGDPTEGALVVAAAKAGLDKTELDMRFPRVHEIPFTSESKRMTTLHATSGGII